MNRFIAFLAVLGWGLLFTLLAMRRSERQSPVHERIESVEDAAPRGRPTQLEQPGLSVQVSARSTSEPAMESANASAPVSPEPASARRVAFRSVKTPPQGHPSWSPIAAKYGSLEPKEYRRLMSEQGGLLFDLKKLYAPHGTVHFPPDINQPSVFGPELDERLGGDNPELSIYGDFGLGGHCCVTFSRERFPDLYEAHQEWVWLLRAADGLFLHHHP